MAKRNKKEKQVPNFIVFLVEGESDILALETPLSELIFEKYPDYEVRFLLQQKIVDKTGDEIDCDVDEEDDDSEFIEESESVLGGDITTSSFVVPQNIEQKIYHRFILPAVRNEGIYPKRIAKIIQITDLDGAFIPDDHVQPIRDDHENCIGPYYNSEQGFIETDNIEGMIERNRSKRSNIEYLCSLSTKGIKIKTKTIPYEIYYFSSNMDHFINNDANVVGGKKNLARAFLSRYGLFTDHFCDFFLNDPDSVGSMGYQESWDWIKDGSRSVMRHTNIDCLIRKLLEK